MRFHDAIVGLVLLAGGIALAIYARTLPQMSGQQFGPGVFPLIVGVGFAATSLLIILRGVRIGRGQKLIEVEPGLASSRGTLGFFAVLAGILLYVLLADWLGFLIVAPVMLLIVLKAQRVAWLPAIATAIVATIFIHYTFYSLLRVPLPWGLLTQYAW